MIASTGGFLLPRGCAQGDVAPVEGGEGCHWGGAGGDSVIIAHDRWCCEFAESCRMGPGGPWGSGFSAKALGDQRAIKIASVACKVFTGAMLLPGPIVLAERFGANDNAVTGNGAELDTVTSRRGSKGEGHGWLVPVGALPRNYSTVPRVPVGARLPMVVFTFGNNTVGVSRRGW